MKQEDLDILKKLKQEYPEEYSNIVENFRDVERQNKILKKEIKNKKELTRLIRHELVNPLNQAKLVLGFIESKFEKEDFDKIKEFAGYGYRAIEDLEKVIDLTRIITSNYSREGILENSECFSPEDLLRSKNIINENLLNESEVALVFKYNHNLNHNKIKIFSSESLFNALLGTLTGNAINYAPIKSKIRSGLREVDGNLEFRIENFSEGKEQRKVSGTGEGIGLKFADEFVKMLNGKIEKYTDKSRIKEIRYMVSERFGYKGDTAEPCADFFGMEVKIPISEISKSTE